MLSRFEQFSFIISGIYRHIQKLEHDEMIKYGYKGVFAEYLMMIARFPEGVTAARLCEISEKDKAAVSRTITELEEKGLVIRENETGRLYNARIKLTKTGKELTKFVARRAQTAVEAVSNEIMTEEERKMLYSTLDAIAAKLQTLSKEGIPKN